MWESLGTNVPIVTAVATLIAALIAATVAVVVALVNAWGSRRIAIDTAHREYRKELADSSVAAAQTFLQELYKLREAVRKRGPGVVDSTVGAGIVANLSIRRSSSRLDVALVQTAAEGYVFSIRRPQRRAAKEIASRRAFQRRWTVLRSEDETKFHAWQGWNDPSAR